jgi:cell wall-associated NlpC family hydrolase
MRRHLFATVVFVCALVLPSGALASQPRTATGTVTAIQSSDFTLQTAGRRTGVINALNEAANAVTEDDYPYVWGGGHAEAGVASKGIKGPGYNGRRVGYDCSGSVAAVLAGAGLWVVRCLAKRA